MAQKVTIIFDGKEGGLIDRMTKVVATGVRQAGLKAVCQAVENARVSDLADADGVIIGTPCHFAGPSAKIKQFLDSTWAARGKLVGKAAGAFTASEHIGGGNEMALHALMDFFLIHGMVVQGDSEGDYFGPVAINPGDPAEIMVDDSGECHRMGWRVAELAKKLNP